MLLLLLLFQARPAAAERRIALVIGINAYQNAPTLVNPVNDAKAIGDALRRLNFEVKELDDADLRALIKEVREFGIKAQSADAAVIYYAGHGVQVDHENYLIPADAKLEREHDVLYEALPLALVLGEVSQAKQIGIVMLDSCRDSPFGARIARSQDALTRTIATTPGMAQVDNVPRNTIVVMAARAGQVAEDGQGHSPFAAAILAHLQIPGIELGFFFRSVRDTVLKATHFRQEPFFFSSLGADPFYFYPRPPNRPPVIDPVPALNVADNAPPTHFGIPRPTDPDQDLLTVRVIGLPRSGEVTIEGRQAKLGEAFSLDHFMAGTFKPDGSILGPIGTLDILVEDGRGGSVTGRLPIVVQSSKPTVVAATPPAAVPPAPVPPTTAAAPPASRPPAAVADAAPSPAGTAKPGTTMAAVATPTEHPAPTAAPQATPGKMAGAPTAPTTTAPSISAKATLPSGDVVDLRTPPPGTTAPAPTAPAPTAPAPTALAPPVVNAPVPPDKAPGSSTLALAVPKPPLAPPALATSSLLSLAEVRDLAKGVPCTLLDLREEHGPQGRLSVSGAALPGPPLSAFLRRLDRPDGPATVAIAWLDNGLCPVLAEISDLVRHSRNRGGIQLEIPDKPIPLGNRLVVTAKDVSDGALYADVYSADGMVRHVRRGLLPRATGRSDVVIKMPLSGSPGLRLLAVMKSPESLDLENRPEAERTVDYLPVLQRKLAQLRGGEADVRAEVVPVSITAAPRPPAAAAVVSAPAHSPHPVDARCVDIVARVQLGQDLSEGDRTFLRTSCGR